MRGFRQYRPIQLLNRRIALAALFILVAVLVNGVWGVYMKERETRANRQQIEANLAELREREESLQMELKQLTSARGLEETLREQYDVALEGEHLLVIVETPLLPAIPPESRWERWFSWWPF
jgi:cell division protein FtsB